MIEAFDVAPERVRAVHHGIAQPEGPGDPVSAPRSACRADVVRYVLADRHDRAPQGLPLPGGRLRSIAVGPPRDLALVIVGADGWGVDAFEDAVRSSSVGARIVRPGYLSDAELAVTLGRATMLAYPSVYEGFGFPPLQAMAAGIPVVTTLAGAVPEVVGDGALLVEARRPGQPGGSHGDDPGRRTGRELLLERGRRQSATFRWDNCAVGLVDLYRDAIACDRRHR